MNLFSIALVIVLVPVILQIILGGLSVYKRISWPFEYISLFNCIAQFLAIFWALKIIVIDAQNQKVRCGMPQAAMFVFGVFSLAVLLVTIIIQMILRSNRKKKITANTQHND